MVGYLNVSPRIERLSLEHPIYEHNDDVFVYSTVHRQHTLVH